MLRTESLDADFTRLMYHHGVADAIAPLRLVYNSTSAGRQHMLRDGEAVRHAYNDSCELLAAVTELEPMLFERFAYKSISCTHVSASRPALVADRSPCHEH